MCHDVPPHMLFSGFSKLPPPTGTRLASARLEPPGHYHSKEWLPLASLTAGGLIHRPFSQLYCNKPNLEQAAYLASHFLS